MTNAFDAYYYLKIAGIFILCFLIGSIPFGVIIAKGFRLGNLRNIGSGSTGATNVVRAGGKLPGALTLLLDTAKGVAAIAFASTLYDHLFLSYYRCNDGPIGTCLLIPNALLYGHVGLWSAAILGHCYSPWLRLCGGKGIAVLIGSYVALDCSLFSFEGREHWHVMTAFFLVVWIVCYQVTRISAVGGLGATIASLFFLCLLRLKEPKMYSVEILVYFSFASLFVIWRHKENILRLVRGEENRFVAAEPEPKVLETHSQ